MESKTKPNPLFSKLKTEADSIHTTQEAPCAHSEAEQMGQLRVPQLSLLPVRLRAEGGTPPWGFPSMVAIKFHTRGHTKQQNTWSLLFVLCDFEIGSHGNSPGCPRTYKLTSRAASLSAGIPTLCCLPEHRSTRHRWGGARGWG